MVIAKIQRHGIGRVNGHPTAQPVSESFHDRFAQHVAQVVSFDDMLLGAFRRDEPRPNEIAMTFGCQPEQVRMQLQSLDLNNGWMHHAFNQGWSASEADREGKHRLMVVVPESINSSRWWCLILSRRQQYTERCAAKASLLLRQWHAMFANHAYDMTGRMLLTRDFQLIACDPFTELSMQANPQSFKKLVNDLESLVPQRWPNLEYNQSHDFTDTLADHPHWISFQLKNHIESPEGEQWYIELRETEADDLPPIGLLDDERVALAMAYIHDRYDQGPSLAQIAQTVHVSPFHFHRLFTKHTGVSPKQYLQRKQLQVARRLLLYTRKPIQHVAKACGFSSHGHFTSTFHRMMDISPSDYREKHG